MTRMNDLLKCRDIGHHWEEIHHRKTRESWGKRRVLRCDVCGTERLEVININGVVDSRHYDYPDDYGKVGGLSKVDARQQRFFKFDSRKEAANKKRDGKGNQRRLRIVS